MMKEKGHHGLEKEIHYSRINSAGLSSHPQIFQIDVVAVVRFTVSCLASISERGSGARSLPAAVSNGPNSREPSLMSHPYSSLRSRLHLNSL